MKYKVPDILLQYQLKNIKNTVKFYLTSNKSMNFDKTRKNHKNVQIIM